MMDSNAPEAPGRDEIVDMWCVGCGDHTISMVNILSGPYEPFEAVVSPEDRACRFCGCEMVFKDPRETGRLPKN